MKMMNNNNRLAALKLGFVFAVVGGLLTACGGYEEYNPPVDETASGTPPEDIDYEKRDTLFGKGGLSLFNSDKPENTGGALGVNSYLWRASLDTISSMPINSADPFGGVIITDWHSYPEAPNERFKLNIFILDRALRADGIRVSAFRQIQDRNGNWRDEQFLDENKIKIEDAILVRARQLRNQSIKK